MKSSLTLAAGLCLFALTGCASIGLGGNDGDSQSSASTTASTAANETRDGLGDAVLTPVSDLNLIERDIPDALTRIENPYAFEPGTACSLIQQEIAELNAVLGADADADYVEDEAEGRGRDAADATLGLVSSTTGSLLPFRGLVRYISGASEADQQVVAAYLRGHQRRGFLRGLNSQQEC